MKSFFKYLIFVLILALGVSYLWVEKNRKSSQRSPNWRPEQFTAANKPVLAGNDLEILSRLDAEYKRLSSVVIPSVVSINTSRRVNVQQPVDPFEYFFGLRRQGRTRQQVQNSLGSGFIVSKEGHIVTNNHVIEGMDEIQIQLSDGRTAPAKILGTDPQTDLAILKIELPDITPLPLGDSDQVEVGQLVFAIGNPYGLQESVTQGIISAKGRRATSDSLVEAFQTDAAVNRGNSGGPLINIRGEVIGVNSSIFSESGGNQGIAFAIPSNTVKNAVESVVQRGRVVRGYLGVTMQNISPELARQMGASGLEGVMIESVSDGSPADKAGIEPGDIITRINSKKITDPISLRNQVASIQLDTTVEIVVLRNQKEQKLTAKIVEQPADFANLAARPSQRQNTPPSSTQQMPPAAPTSLAGIGVEDSPDGVVVSSLTPGTPAADKLQVGDFILEINRNPIRSVDEYRAYLSTLNPQTPHILYVVRGPRKAFVVIPPR